MLINFLDKNINSIMSYKNSESVKKGNYKIQSDVFQKNVISFKSDDNKSYSEFRIWAQKNDFLSKAQEIVERTGKIIGRGFEGVIYEIPQTDNWVIKEYKRSSLVRESTQNANIQEYEDVFPKINAGQCIAFINIPCGKNYTSKYYILQKQTGKPLGVSYMQAQNIDKINLNQHFDMLSTLANAPDKAYDDLLKNIDYVFSKGYTLDVLNPNNFLYDNDKEKINFVDVNDLYHGSGNLYGEVLFALLDGYFSIELMKSENFDEEQENSKELSKKITEKYFGAMQRANLKFKEGEQFNLLLNSPVLDDILTANSFEDKINALKQKKLY